MGGGIAATMVEDENDFEGSPDEGEIAIEEKKPDEDPPKRYAVILHNDDYTTMEFVVEVLSQFFGRTPDQAAAIMLKIHHDGRGVAGKYSFEIAETKVAQVTDYARKNGFPLKCTCEPVDEGS